MSESTAVEAPAAKEPFFKMSSIPGANILVPLLLGCLLNTLFPDLFKTLGSFTLGMTQQGAGPLVGAFFGSSSVRRFRLRALLPPLPAAPSSSPSSRSWSLPCRCSSFMCSTTTCLASLPW